MLVYFCNVFSAAKEAGGYLIHRTRASLSAVSVDHSTFPVTSAAFIFSSSSKNLTSAESPSSSLSLILFTCLRRRSQYNLSSDILVFSASVFS